jgi:signal transduction histidine kinase
VVLDQPVFRDDGTAVISTLMSEAVLDHGVWRAWAVLILLGLVLVILSLVVADRLARSMTRPVTDLARTAERLGQGDLDARAEPAGPGEIREVGTALNRLAARIRELLAAERESVADLSHRLRTPVTALRLDAEGLADPEERGRLVADVDELTRHVDAVIREARRPVREGVRARCDARAVVADRVAFWQVLADDQGRQFDRDLDLTAGPLPVRASAADLAVAVDALLGNVFSHTPDGTCLAVRVRARPGGGAEVVVRDGGPGFADEDVLHRGESRSGSTGLGLDIARRTAVASGGRLEVRPAAEGGAEVVLQLGPAD